MSTGFYGAAPAGAARYAKADAAGRAAEFVAWTAPATGDGLCLSITGMREAALVRAILDGRFDDVLYPRPA